MKTTFKVLYNVGGGIVESATFETDEQAQVFENDYKVNFPVYDRYYVTYRIDTVKKMFRKAKSTWTAIREWEAR